MNLGESGIRNNLITLPDIELVGMSSQRDRERELHQACDVGSM